MKLKNCHHTPPQKKIYIYIGHCTHTTESADAKVQNIFHGQNSITCGTNCKHRTPATVYTLETWFVSGM